MAKVRLRGLNIYQRRGKWYVYYRPNGRALLTGFNGSRMDLERAMSEPAFLDNYAAIAERPKAKGYGTLSGLIDFYKTKDKWKKLAPRTKQDYQKVIDWLNAQAALKVSVIQVLPKHIANVRDKAAKDRYPKFSNDALALLSAAFRTGKTYGYAGLKTNPVEGMDRLHRNSKNANRRWTEEEWTVVWRIAPSHLRPVLALARWAGPRGQDVAKMRWDNIIERVELGPCLEYTAQKNKADVIVALWPVLQSALEAEQKTTLTICKNSKGRPYPSENAMRKAWQDFKSGLEFTKLVPTGADLTLHGLRVTFASELRELGFSNEQIARMIGDKTERMGNHYARGADGAALAKMVKDAKKHGN